MCNVKGSRVKNENGVVLEADEVIAAVVRRSNVHNRGTEARKEPLCF